MLGQPASSQTVCRPSRRTSDFSSVYSGPVFSLVLIHSGLRSIGTWLLRTSRRSSLRPAGSGGSRCPAVVLPAAQHDGDGRTRGEEREHPRPPLPRLLDAGLPLHLLGRVGSLLGELAPLLAGDLARLLRRLACLATRLLGG